ncbi:hypothetical protein M8818_000762 [Zalaria obscura]|uniref:Uncharacterized protein n=1 Tax=Zalaria obscura TaxID=2024903 RepID=A0ACC3SM75_9PEZI
MAVAQKTRESGIQDAQAPYVESGNPFDPINWIFPPGFDENIPRNVTSYVWTAGPIDNQPLTYKFHAQISNSGDSERNKLTDGGVGYNDNGFVPFFDPDDDIYGWVEISSGI